MGHRSFFFKLTSYALLAVQAAALAYVNPPTAAAEDTAQPATETRTLGAFASTTSVPSSAAEYWLDCFRGNLSCTDNISQGKQYGAALPEYVSKVKGGNVVLTQEGENHDIVSGFYCYPVNTYCFNNWQYLYQKREVDVAFRWVVMLNSTIVFTKDLYKVKDDTQEDGEFFKVIRAAGSNGQPGAITGIELNEAGKKYLDESIIGTGDTPPSSKGMDNCAPGIFGSDNMCLYTAKAIEQQGALMADIQTLLSSKKPGGGTWMSEADAKRLNGNIDRVTNLKDIMLGDPDKGNDPKFLGKYTSLSEFETDYKQLRAFLGNLTSKMAPGSGGLAPAKIQDELMKAAIEGKATDEKNIQNSGQAKDECGGAQVWQPIRAIGVAFCAITVTVRNLVQSLLVSSLKLLGITAGIPGEIKSTGAFEISAGTLPSYCGLTTADCTIQNDVANPNSEAGSFIREAHDYLLRGVNILLIMIFIVIGLANIFQIQINVWSINKMVPGLIMGFVLAHMSFFIMRASLELAGQATGIFATEIKKVESTEGGVCDVQYDKSALGYYARTFATVSNPSGDNCKPMYLLDDGSPNWPVLLKQFFVNGLTVAAAVFIFIVGFLLVVRVFVFYILFVTAPLAIMCAFFPPLNKYWTMWWNTIKNWLFMPTVVMFWIWLSLAFLKASQNGENPGFFSFLLGYIFTIFCLYMAIKTPFSMAGDAKVLVNNWNKMGKSAWKNTGGKGVEIAGNKTKAALLNTRVAQSVMTSSERLNLLAKQSKEQVEEAKAKAKQEAEQQLVAGTRGKDGKRVMGFAALQSGIYRRTEGHMIGEKEDMAQQKERVELAKARFKIHHRGEERFVERQKVVEIGKETNTNLENSIKSRITAAKNNIKDREDGSNVDLPHAREFRAWQASKAAAQNAENAVLKSEMGRASGDGFNAAYSENIVVKELKAKGDSNWERARKQTAYGLMTKPEGKYHDDFEKVEREEIISKRDESVSKKDRDIARYELINNDRSLRRAIQQTKYNDAAVQKNIDKALNLEAFHQAQAVEDVAALTGMLGKGKAIAGDDHAQMVKILHALNESSKDDKNPEDMGKFKDILDAVKAGPQGATEADRTALHNKIMQAYSEHYGIDTEMKNGKIEANDIGKRSEKLIRADAASTGNSESNDIATRDELMDHFKPGSKKLANLGKAISGNLGDIEGGKERSDAVFALGAISKQASKGELPPEVARALVDEFKQNGAFRAMAADMSYDGNPDTLVADLEFALTKTSTSGDQSKGWKAILAKHHMDQGGLSNKERENTAAVLIPRSEQDKKDNKYKNPDTFTKFKNEVRRREQNAKKAAAQAESEDEADDTDDDD